MYIKNYSKDFHIIKKNLFQITAVFWTLKNYKKNMVSTIKEHNCLITFNIDNNTQYY